MVARIAEANDVRVPLPYPIDTPAAQIVTGYWKPKASISHPADVAE
jgi:hypothetical protein